MVAPGKYTLRLTASTGASTKPWTATTTLVVRADPRIAKAGVTQREMEAQLAHNLRVRDLVRAGGELVGRDHQQGDRPAG